MKTIILMMMLAFTIGTVQTKAMTDEDLPKSNIDGMSLRSIEKQFATFKKTSDTKVYTVDDFSTIEMSYYNENRAFVFAGQNGLFCFDEKGNKLESWSFEEAKPMQGFKSQPPRFSKGRLLACVQVNGKKQAILYDSKFREIKKFGEVRESSNFIDGVAFYRKSVLKNGQWENVNILVDENGNEVMKQLMEPFNSGHKDFQPKNLRPLSDGLSAFCVPSPNSTSNLVWGFRDATGKVVVPAKYDMVQDFSNGLAAVATGKYSNAKWGFIDTKGQMVIPQKFSYAPSKFDECGLALVIDKEGLSTFMDKKGEISKRRYDSVTPFCGGLAILKAKDSSGQFMTYVFDKGYELLATYGKAVTAPKTGIRDGMAYYQEDGRDFSYACKTSGSLGSKAMLHEGHIYVTISGYDGGNIDLHYGLLSTNGNLVIAGLSGPFHDGLAPVCNTEKGEVGYVNMKGEWVIKFEKNDF